MTSLHILSQSQSATKPQYKYSGESTFGYKEVLYKGIISHEKFFHTVSFLSLSPFSLNLWSGRLVTTTGYIAKLRYDNFIPTFNGYKRSKLYQFSHDSFPKNQ